MPARDFRYILTDRALHSLLAVSDVDARRLLSALEQIAAEATETRELAAEFTPRRALLIRRVGEYAILFWPARGERPPYIFDIRMF
jgi:hypothetical protein